MCRVCFNVHDVTLHLTPSIVGQPDHPQRVVLLYTSVLTAQWLLMELIYLVETQRSEQEVGEL